MIASPTASTPSRPQTSSRCCAMSGVQAAVLVHPPLPCESAGDAIRQDAAAEQARALQRTLPRGWRIFSVTGATLDQAVAEAAALRPSRLIVVAMPGFDAREIIPALERCGLEPSAVEIRTDWFDEASLVEAHARHIHSMAVRHNLSPGNAVLWLRLPGSEDGAAANWRTVAELVALRLGWPSEALRIESAADAPAAAAGCRILLHDLNLAAGTDEAVCGDAASIRCGSVPAQSMLCVLNSLVRRGRHPAKSTCTRSPALFSWGCRGRERSLAQRLVMIGISVQGALGRGEGPALRYCTKDAFSQSKRSHVEVLDFLHGLRGGLFSEALIWNTCNRLELFAWLHPDTCEEGARRGIAKAADQLLGSAASSASILCGTQALQHLHRTAAGMNSTLAGDAEVLDQLQSALRTSAHVGMGGVRCEALFDDAASMVDRLRRQTPWGAYAHRYCRAALDRLRPHLWNGTPPRRAVVVGGSTTGASVLETLAADFGLPHASLSLVYRGQRSGALTRRLEAAIGGGRTVNVDCYNDPTLVGEVAAADAVFLAGDHREPILCGNALREARAQAGVCGRPLTVVDFNTFPSTANLDAVEGARLLNAAEIELAIQSFNRDVLSQPAFARALAAAEALIAEHTGVRCAPAVPQEMVYS
jgi:glutamyl-tRNA reductase